MTIEYVSKAKVETLSTIIPQVVAKALLAPEDADFILLSDEKVLSTYFVVAITACDEIIWISDESYRNDIAKFIEGTI